MATLKGSGSSIQEQQKAQVVWEQHVFAEISWLLDSCDCSWLEDVETYELVDDWQLLVEYATNEPIKISKIDFDGNLIDEFIVSQQEFVCLATQFDDSLDLDDIDVHDTADVMGRYDYESAYELIRDYWNTEEFDYTAVPSMFQLHGEKPKFPYDSYAWDVVEDAEIVDMSSTTRQFERLFIVSNELGQALEKQGEVVTTDPGNNIVWCVQGSGMAPVNTVEFVEAALSLSPEG